MLSTQLENNEKQGKAFEDTSYDKYSETRPEAVREDTVKTDSGVKPRVDMMGRDTDGEISCVECKSSDTALLT